MVSLALKLALAPALVALATVAGRRLGHHVGGLVGSLPVVAAPIVLIYAVDHGDAYARHAAGWTVYGIGALAVFCGLYAALARRVPALPLTALGWTAFGVLIALLWALHPPVALGLPLTLAVVAAISSSLGRPEGGTGSDETASGSELAWRMAATAVLVITLTALAGSLGPRLAGLLAPFPIVTAVLSYFTHVQEGPEAARELLRGYTPGLASFAAFFGVLSVALGPLPLGLAFTLALLAALAGHVLLYLTWLRPRPERERGPVSAVAVFALSGALALLAVGAIAVGLLQNASREEALRLAKSDTRLAARAVGPALTPALVAGSPAAAPPARRPRPPRRARGPGGAAQGVDRRSAGSSTPTSRGLIGQHFPLGAGGASTRCGRGGPTRRSATSTRAGEPLRAPRRQAARGLPPASASTGGKPLLFETYRRYSSVDRVEPAQAVARLRARR